MDASFFLAAADLRPPTESAAMCGRYVLAASGETVADFFDVTRSAVDFAPRYNIAPTQIAPVIRLDDNSERSLAWLRWGLVPRWAKDLSIGSRMINARSETAPEKPAFRDAYRRRRCLIPASGFYEWKKSSCGK